MLTNGGATQLSGPFVSENLRPSWWMSASVGIAPVNPVGSAALSRLSNHYPWSTIWISGLEVNGPKGGLTVKWSLTGGAFVCRTAQFRSLTVQNQQLNKLLNRRRTPAIEAFDEEILHRRRDFRRATDSVSDLSAPGPREPDPGQGETGKCPGHRPSCGERPASSGAGSLGKVLLLTRLEPPIINGFYGGALCARRRPGP